LNAYSPDIIHFSQQRQSEVRTFPDNQLTPVDGNFQAIFTQRRNKRNVKSGSNQ
jgi:hypothetical protein